MRVEGDCRPEFHPVREAFERNFLQHQESGAACCIYYQGRRVVDLWGGARSLGAIWRPDTLALTFSVTKGMAAAALAVAHSRGWYDFDAPVAEYWPEFSQGGKGQLTIRQLLAHQAGLVAVDQSLTIHALADPELMAQILARATPAWQPGVRHGYHTLTLGWYQAEFLRRIDPEHRTLGRFFQEEIAEPLDVEFYIGLPDHIDETRLAVTPGFHRAELLLHLRELPAAMVFAGLWPRSLTARSVNPLRLSNPAHLGKPEYRRLEIPSANGFGDARSIAKVYSWLAGASHELPLARTTRRELCAAPEPPAWGSRDAVLKMDTNYACGFSKPSRDMRFGSDASAFGAPGAGGCFGMADPTRQVGYAYITNKMGFRLFDDPRERACREALYRCLNTQPSVLKKAS